MGGPHLNETMKPNDKPPVFFFFGVFVGFAACFCAVAGYFGTGFLVLLGGVFTGIIIDAATRQT